MEKSSYSNTIKKSNGLPDFAIKRLESLKENWKMENDAVLEIRNIDKIYENGFQAIFGSSLLIKKGEFIALLGPSGCGKTTTLRMIAGLESVSSGKIYINGLDMTSSEPKDRDLTMVFQNYALFPHLSVKKNIIFGLISNKKKLGEGGILYKKIRILKNQLNSKMELVSNLTAILKSRNKEKQDKFKKRIIKIKKSINDLKNKDDKKTKVKFALLENILKSEVKKRDYYYLNIDNIGKIKKEVLDIGDELKTLEAKRKLFSKEDEYDKIIKNKLNYAADILGLNYYLDRKPSQLSGGQRQRVALGRSLVSSPNLFLMDEPLSNLDAKLRASMRKKIRELHDKINTATVYVTHDQIEAMTMSDKIVVMSDGFIQQVGTPKEIYKNPANIFVATFVGTPSMNLFDGKIINKKFISDSGFSLKISNEKLKFIKNEQKVKLGIRPTDIKIDDSHSDEGKTRVEVKIVLKELLGNEIQYSCKILEDLEKKDSKIIFITSSYNDYEIGEKIKIYLINSRMHLFDEKTTISLTSEFNYETLNSLYNWSTSNEKIRIRREILERNRKKEIKKGFFKKINDFLIKEKNKWFLNKRKK